jgi:hypothetical protein
MKSPLRIFFILPIVLTAMITVFQLLQTDGLHFTLWFFALIIVSSVCLPLIIPPREERYVPIYQMFFIFVSFVIVAIVISFFDLRNFFSPDKALIISVFVGLGIVGISLFLRRF